MAMMLWGGHDQPVLGLLTGVLTCAECAERANSRGRMEQLGTLQYLHIQSAHCHSLVVDIQLWGGQVTAGTYSKSRHTSLSWLCGRGFTKNGLNLLREGGGVMVSSCTVGSCRLAWSCRLGACASVSPSAAPELQ